MTKDFYILKYIYSFIKYKFYKIGKKNLFIMVIKSKKFVWCSLVLSMIIGFGTQCCIAAPPKRMVQSELSIKKYKIQKYQSQFLEVEKYLFDKIGKCDFDELRKIQKDAKKTLGLSTQRVDWRTKTGIVL